MENSNYRFYLGDAKLKRKRKEKLGFFSRRKESYLKKQCNSCIDEKNKCGCSGKRCSNTCDSCCGVTANTELLDSYLPTLATN